MTTPKEISPNPLVTSTVEIRFSTSIDSSKLFSMVYPVFASELPTFEESKLPKEIKLKEEQFKFAPDYILKNEDFSFSFSNNSISFENVSDYKLWGKYFPFIEQQLQKFFGLNIISDVLRIGVRYASIFEGQSKIANVLQFSPTLPIDGYGQEFALMRLDLKKEDFNFHIQLANNAKVQKNGKSCSGVYIDIDSSLTKVIRPNMQVINIISDLHNEGKMLFFSKFIKPEFLETLNPKY